MVTSKVPITQTTSATKPSVATDFAGLTAPSTPTPTEARLTVPVETTVLVVFMTFITNVIEAKATPSTSINAPITAASETAVPTE